MKTAEANNAQLTGKIDPPFTMRSPSEDSFGTLTNPGYRRFVSRMRATEESILGAGFDQAKADAAYVIGVETYSPCPVCGEEDCTALKHETEFYEQHAIEIAKRHAELIPILKWVAK